MRSFFQLKEFEQENSKRKRLVTKLGPENVSFGTSKERTAFVPVPRQNSIRVAKRQVLTVKRGMETDAGEGQRQSRGVKEIIVGRKRHTAPPGLFPLISGFGGSGGEQVAMMQPAESREGQNSAGHPLVCFLCASGGRFLRQSEVRAVIVVIPNVFGYESLHVACV
jgi:hypothetical protein